MLDSKTAALIFSRVVDGLLSRVKAMVGGGLPWLASEFSCVRNFLGFPRRWFEYFTGTALALLSSP